MRSFLLVLVACGASHGGNPAALSATPTEGTAIAIYANGERSYAVVDDRRWIEVAGGTILLDRIDPAAPLQSLVIEALDAREPLRVTACIRERVDDSPAGLASLAQARGERPKRLIVIDDHATERFHFEETKQLEPAVLPDPRVLSPVVRCTVVARAGKHLVRVLHVTSTLGFRTMHDLVMTEPERAEVATRFAIRTPAWSTRAEVALFEGLPGDQTTPRELARGAIVLDGSTAILAIDGGRSRLVPARLRTIYDGAKLDDADDIKPNDIAWARESRHQVWVWLELTTPLATGAIRAHVELPNQPARDVEVAAELREQTRDHSMTRFPLWIDEDLMGTRHRTIDRADGVIITDRVVLTISNLGTQPRDVWIEERLRPSPRRRALTQSWPSRPLLVNDFARTKLTLAPGQTERLGFTIDYEF